MDIKDAEFKQIVDALLILRMGNLRAFLRNKKQSILKSFVKIKSS